MTVDESVDAMTNFVQPLIHFVVVDFLLQLLALHEMPLDRRIVKIVPDVVSRVMQTSRLRTFRVDPIAAVSVPGIQVGIVPGQLALHVEFKHE